MTWSWTSSGNLYISGYNCEVGGGQDAFAAKISPSVGAAPLLTSLLPREASAGDPAILLSVVGSGLFDGAVMRWDGSDRATLYVRSSELQAAIPASGLEAGGDVQVTVFNPAPARDLTGALTLQVSSFTAAAGQSAACTIQVTPQYGTFDSAVSFSCSGLPTKCTAAFFPVSVAPGGAAAPTTMTLAARASAIWPPPRFPGRSAQRLRRLASRPGP